MGEIQKVMDIPVKDICPDENQPREHFDEPGLVALGKSMLENGQHQAIRVRPIKSKEKVSGYKLIFGQRRWEAAKRVEMETLRAEVVEVTDEKEIFLMQVIENGTRENLRPMEQINAYVKAVNRKFTLEEIGSMFGVTAGTVQKDLMLVDLPNPVKKAIDKKQLSKEVAHVIREMPKETWMKAFKWAMKNPASAKSMKRSIRLNYERASQGSLWGDLPRKPGDVIGMSDGKLFTLKDGMTLSATLYKKLEKFLSIYEGNEKKVLAVADGMPKKVHIATIEKIGDIMSKIGPILQEQVKGWKEDPNNVAKLAAEAEKKVVNG